MTIHELIQFAIQYGGTILLVVVAFGLGTIFGDR